MEHLEQNKINYSILNLKKETKERIEKIYYSLKFNKKYKSYDDFINDVLNLFEGKE